MRTITCSDCQKPFQTDEPEQVFWILRCPACAAANDLRTESERSTNDARASARKVMESDARWRKTCPLEFRTLTEGGRTDEQRLLQCQPKAATLLKHDLSRGLLLRGPSGACKTRLIWRLLRRAHESGISFVEHTSGSFERAYRDAAGNHRLEEWFGKQATAGIFFMDDLGKMPWKPDSGTIGIFFDLVDERCKHGRPIWLTTNYNGETLTERLHLGKDLSEPLLRRLREFCDQMVLVEAAT